MTEIYMLQDKSQNLEATWEFLDRRIDDVMTGGQSIGMTRNLAGAMTTGISSIFSIMKPQGSKFEADDAKMR